MLLFHSVRRQLYLCPYLILFKHSVVLTLYLLPLLPVFIWVPNIHSFFEFRS